MKNSIFVCLLFIAIFNCIVAPPVTEKKKDDISNKENEIPTKEDGFGVEYERYLQEVVQALESDPRFREILQKAEDADIRTGKIANELEFVNHAVRSRLDEVKRAEMERLRHYARKAYELQQGLDTEHMKIQPHLETDHIDHSNPHTFEVEDLRKLIAKTTKDLAEADEKRREEFKAYEMQKEFEHHEMMKNMSDEDKKKFEQEINEMKEKHKKHAPLHHPGSKQQLEEVWEKQDHMDNQDFDPKAFFHMHDLDGNGVWDAVEVKALFLKELDKMYQAGAPEDDMNERNEEMERMREHVFKETDTNRDGLISFEEFLAQTQRPDFNADPGWEGLDQQTVYSQDEYQRFEMQRQHEIEAMIADGRLPPHPVQNMHPPPSGMQHRYPNAGFGDHPQQIHEPYQQGHPQQFQNGHPQQFQPGHSQHIQQGHAQQFQPGQPQQMDQRHAQQYQQAHPQQFHSGQPQQFQQAHPQQFQSGQPQQFQQAHPQQFQSGQPQQFQQAAAQQAHSQQFQPAHPQQFQQNVQPQQLQQGPIQSKLSPQISQLGNAHPVESQPPNQSHLQNESSPKGSDALPVANIQAAAASETQQHANKVDPNSNSGQASTILGVRQI